MGCTAPSVRIRQCSACTDITNKKAIEAGISVYNRAKGKPIVNSADAGDRITNIDLAAANDAICIALALPVW